MYKLIYASWGYIIFYTWLCMYSVKLLLQCYSHCEIVYIWLWFFYLHLQGEQGLIQTLLTCGRFQNSYIIVDIFFEKETRLHSLRKWNESNAQITIITKKGECQWNQIKLNY